jgi:hypothetical protein
MLLLEVSKDGSKPVCCCLMLRSCSCDRVLLLRLVGIGTQTQRKLPTHAVEMGTSLCGFAPHHTGAPVDPRELFAAKQ